MRNMPQLNAAQYLLLLYGYTTAMCQLLVVSRVDVDQASQNNYYSNTHCFFCRFLLDGGVLHEEVSEGILGKVNRGQLLPNSSPRSGHRLLIQHHLSPVQLL